LIPLHDLTPVSICAISVSNRYRVSICFTGSDTCSLQRMKCFKPFTPRLLSFIDLWIYYFFIIFVLIKLCSYHSAVYLNKLIRSNLDERKYNWNFGIILKVKKFFCFLPFISTDATSGAESAIPPGNMSYPLFLVRFVLLDL